MLHNELFDVFKAITHIPDDAIDCWFPNGKRSVRVRLKNGLEVILTYDSPRKWAIETKDFWLED